MQAVGQVIAQPSTATEVRASTKAGDGLAADCRQRPLHRFHTGDHLVRTVEGNLVPRQVGQISRRGLQPPQTRRHLVDGHVDGHSPPPYSNVCSNTIGRRGQVQEYLAINSCLYNLPVSVRGNWASNEIDRGHL